MPQLRKAEKSDKIFIAGAGGMVGSALHRALLARGFANLLTPGRAELDLTDQAQTREYFRKHRPDFVYIAAAKVGGIHANNTFPAEFFYDNLMIATNCLKAAAEHGSEKVLFLGSSCIYPKHCPQPMKEEYLMTGPLEPTNEAYAFAKIAGLKLCEYFQKEHGKRFISAMPTNLYGINDNFHPEYSHVIPGLLRRFHESKKSKAAQIAIWGTGTPRREFLDVDDLAEALILLMDKYEEPKTINVGYGSDQTIAELASMIKETVGYEGQLVFDPSKPDGTPLKLLDSSRIRAMGWEPKVDLKSGLQKAYEAALKSGAL